MNISSNSAQLKKMMNLIQPALDSVSEMQGIWLKFVDTSGKYILTAQSVNPCEFCCLIRSVPEGLERCHNNAQLAVKKSEARGGPVKITCHAGLTMIVVPVMIEKQCLGALIAGEIVEKERCREIEETVLNNTSQIPLDKDEILRCLRNINCWTEKQINATTRALDAFSNCFIEVGSTAAKKEKVELEKHLKDVELRALQNQINPHFLFNTLNTIKMLSIIEEAEQTSEVVHALAQLCRRNLYSENSLIPVYQELESINDYLTIQKYRFGDRLNIVDNIPSSLKNAQIPALTLQPIVENAVIHGLEPKEEPGLLKLEGFLNGDDIVFQVIDNGVGIYPDKLAEINRELHMLSKEPRRIGLFNVQKRCQLYYKNNAYGINIKSTPGKGTIVSLSLPSQVKKGGVGLEGINSR